MELIKSKKDMKYKGYRVSKEFYVPSLMGSGRHKWLVFKDGRNVWFDTLREAKEWVNSVIN